MKNKKCSVFLGRKLKIEKKCDFKRKFQIVQVNPSIKLIKMIYLLLVITALSISSVLVNLPSEISNCLSNLVFPFSRLRTGRCVPFIRPTKKVD